MLRVVSDADGGNTGGSASPILNNVVPSHTHSFSTGNQSADHFHSGNTGNVSANHVHQFIADAVGAAGNDNPDRPKWNVKQFNNYGGRGKNTELISANHFHSFSTGFVSDNHSHSGTTDNGSSQTDWSPRYINMILCSKN